ncbi:hypothetical protein ABTY20_17640 [Streptomyces sp. NPDC126497]|uniref:hypothetical protein n=1 Tax=Streptomyces sp. NPDC126497 TaxID=3155313 RepID=UPI003331AEBD
MRGVALRRPVAAGLTVAALVAGLAGCTGDPGGDGEGKAAATACADGAYAWSGIRRTQELTAMADPIRIEEETDSYEARLEPVGDPVRRPSVTGAPRGVGAAGVIRALGARLRTEEPLAGPSETERADEDHYFEVATGDLKGAYYAWGWIDLVEADFTYTCGSAEPVRGRVRTWEGTGSGFLSCSETAGEDDVPARTAGRGSCPAGSAAAEAEI